MLRIKAQNIVEYVIVVSIVSTALITMSTYLQRSIQGVVKLSIDEIGLQEREEFSITESATLLSLAEDIETGTSEITTGENGTEYMVYNPSLPHTDPGYVSYVGGAPKVRKVDRTFTVKPVAGSLRETWSFTGSTLKDIDR